MKYIYKENIKMGKKEMVKKICVTKRKENIQRKMTKKAFAEKKYN